MNGDRGSAKSGAAFGAVLVVVGSVLLMERLDLLHTNLLGHFWPLALLVAGILVFTNGRQLVGGVLVFGGVVLELRRLGIIRMHIWDLWPLALVAVGVLLLYRALYPPESGSDGVRSTEPRISEYAIFGGSDTKVESQNFEGGNVTAVFGGHEIDLRGARIVNSPAVLYADAIFGGVALKVPQTWRVTGQGQAIFGGVETKKTMTPQNNGEPEQHLIVRGLAVFGGVEVKN